MKVCPVCKSRCFDDMDTCYGCLYKFKETNNTREEMNMNVPRIHETQHMPEYFAMEENVDKYLMLEDVQEFLDRRYLEDSCDNLPNVKINRNNKKIIIEIYTK